MPILSICIPTYNRNAQLQKLLSDLQGCASILGDQIEILISDNCSTDTTEQLVRQMPQDFPIRYFRQSVNIGPTSNYLFLLTKSQGSYCWVTGDDDAIYAKEIVKLVNHLKAHSACSLLLVDTWLGLKCSKKLISMPRHGPCGSADIFIEIFKKSLFPFGHYTSLVFNRESVSSIIDGVGASPIAMGFWPHQFLLLAVLWTSKLPSYIYPFPLAMQGLPPSGETMSILHWSGIEASRLNMISSDSLQIPWILKLIFVSRELFSRRLFDLLMLIAIITPSSKYPFSLSRHKNRITNLAYRVISFFPRLAFSFSVPFFSLLGKYSRLYIRLCHKYSVCAESSAPIDSPRHLFDT